MKMARTKTIVWACDLCGKEISAHGHYVPPPDWMKIIIQTSAGNKTRNLCDECVRRVMKSWRLHNV